MSLADEFRLGRSDDDDVILECVNQDPYQITHNLLAVGRSSSATMAHHLKNSGVHNLRPMFDPHDLTEAQAQLLSKYVQIVAPRYKK